MHSLVPEVVVQPAPGGEFAPRVDEHGGVGGAVGGQLAVGGVGAHLGISLIDWCNGNGQSF